MERLMERLMEKMFGDVEGEDSWGG